MTPAPPVPLPGQSSTTLIWRGFLFMAAAAACVVPLMLEGVLPGRWYYYAIPALIVAGIALTVAMVLMQVGYRKDRRERARGYTTDLRRARRQPDLYLLHPKNLQLVSAPGQPRPAKFVQAASGGQAGEGLSQHNGR